MIVVWVWGASMIETKVFASIVSDSDMKVSGEISAIIGELMIAVDMISGKASTLTEKGASVTPT